jgi:hypothetical protein
VDCGPYFEDFQGALCNFQDLIVLTFSLRGTAGCFVNLLGSLLQFDARRGMLKSWQPDQTDGPDQLLEAVHLLSNRDRWLGSNGGCHLLQPSASQGTAAPST